MSLIYEGRGQKYRYAAFKLTGIQPPLGSTPL
jgi:hypothetical protein